LPISPSVAPASLGHGLNQATSPVVAADVLQLVVVCPLKIIDELVPWSGLVPVVPGPFALLATARRRAWMATGVSDGNQRMLSLLSFRRPESFERAPIRPMSILCLFASDLVLRPAPRTGQGDGLMLGRWGS